MSNISEKLKKIESKPIRDWDAYRELLDQLLQESIILKSWVDEDI